MTLTTIDAHALDTVTGGARTNANIDAMLKTLNTMTDSLRDIKTKTNGLGQGEMLLLCVMAMQRRSANVVVVGRQPTYWW
jgi:hypothetical protein